MESVLSHELALLFLLFCLAISKNRVPENDLSKRFFLSIFVSLRVWINERDVPKEHLVALFSVLCNDAAAFVRAEITLSRCRHSTLQYDAARSFFCVHIILTHDPIYINYQMLSKKITSWNIGKITLFAHAIHQSGWPI